MIWNQITEISPVKQQIKNFFIICLLSHSEHDPIHSETCLNQLLNKTESLYSILNKVPIKSFLIQSAYTEHLSIPKTKAGPKEAWLRQVSLHKQSMGIFF